MPMNRGIWLILAAVILVAIGFFVWPTAKRTTEAPPAAQAPAAAPPGQPAAKQAAGAGSAAQTSEQKSTPAPAPAPAAQTAQKEPAPAPQPAAASSAPTAEKETAPAPAATAPAAAAPAAEKETAPAPPSAPAVQTAEKESAPALAPSPAAPAAPVGEKAPAAMDKEGDPHANDKASAELASLQPGFVPKDLVAALNHSVINFPSDSAEVPASMTDFLQKAAEGLKQLPKGHVVEIAGYTDNTGGQALNVALSQKRAEAVWQTLVRFGANPDMLIAKGYGSADPVASNDTPKGRQRNRRIEYHIVTTP
jgi:outer membrane protein OmpA-like peptidoglycan-associated protein